MIDPSVAGLLLLAAIVAVPLLLRRHRASAPDGVRVVGRTALHKNAVVAIVAVGDRRLLVGAGERGVQLLTDLTADLTPEEAAGVAAPSDPAITDTASTDTAVTDTAVTDTDLAAFLAPRSPDRMDAAGTGTGPRDTTTDPGTAAVLASLEGTAPRTIAGPRIGLVDRLRGMTVRTPVQGRPFHDVLRR